MFFNGIFLKLYWYYRFFAIIDVCFSNNILFTDKINFLIDYFW